MIQILPDRVIISNLVLWRLVATDLAHLPQPLVYDSKLKKQKALSSCILILCWQALDPFYLMNHHPQAEFTPVLINRQRTAMIIFVHFIDANKNTFPAAAFVFNPLDGQPMKQWIELHSTSIVEKHLSLAFKSARQRKNETCCILHLFLRLKYGWRQNRQSNG